MSLIPTDGTVPWGDAFRALWRVAHNDDGTEKSPGAQTLAEVLANGNDAAAGRIVDLADPVSAQDAATKNYVDTEIAGVGGGGGTASNVLTVYNVVEDYGADPTGVNDSTGAVRAAYAAARIKGGIVYFPPGTFLMSVAGGSANAVTLVAGSKPVTFRGAGKGATTVKLSASTWNFICGDVGTGNTVPDLVVEDITFDMNNAQTNTTGGIIYTMFSAVNVGLIWIRRCSTINVGTSTTAAGRRAVDVTVYVQSVAQAMTVDTVIVEDCDFNGGNTGVLVEGYRTGSNSTNAQRATDYWPTAFRGNCSVDTVIIRRCFHDTLLPSPPAGIGSNFMVGQYANVTRCVIQDCVGLNSLDDGIEVDSVIDCVIERCDMSGAKNESYFFSNLNGMPCDLDDQWIRFRDCRGDLFYMQSLGTRSGHVYFENCDGVFWLFGSYKSVTLTNCSYFSNSARSTFGYTAALAAINLAMMGGRGTVRIDNFKYANKSTVDGTPGGGFGFYPVVIDNLADYELFIDGIDIKATPTLTNGAKSEVGAVVFFRSGSGLTMTDPFSGSGPWGGGNYFTDAGSPGDINVGSAKLTGNLNLSSEKRFGWIAESSQFQWGHVGLQTDTSTEVDGAPGATLAGWKLGAVAKRVDASNYMEAYLSDDGTATTLNLDVVIGGVRTALTTPVETTRIATGTVEQVGISVIGDSISGLHRIANVTQATIAATLTTTQSKAVGSWVQGYSGFSWIPISNTATITKMLVTRRHVVSGTVKKVDVKAAVNVAGTEFFGSYLFPWDVTSAVRINGTIRFEDCNSSRVDGRVKLSDPATLANVIDLDRDGYSSPVTFSRSGALTVAAGVQKFPCPVAGTIVGIRAAVGTAPVGANLICDVDKNGTTIFTTQANRPTITAGSTSSPNATPDIVTVAAGDLLSVDVDQIGSSTAGADLTVVVFIRF